MSFFYRAHGLAIESDLHLPFWQTVPGVDAVDVSISYGEAPHDLADPLQVRAGYQCRDRETLFTNPNAGRVWVRDGRQIVVDPLPDRSDELAAIVVTSGLAALLHQRGLAVLTGSAVLTANGAVVLYGSAFSGKTTLAAALHESGYPLICDGLVSLHCLNEACFVTGGAGGLFMAAGDRASAGLRRHRFHRMTDKGTRLWTEWPSVTGTNIPVHAFINVVAAPRAPLELSDITNRKAFEAFWNYTAWSNIAIDMGLRRQVFENCSGLAKIASMKQLLRPLESVDPAGSIELALDVVRGVGVQVPADGLS